MLSNNTELQGSDDLYDHPVPFNIYDIPSYETGRQRFYFSTLYTLLPLYNYADFVKMHIHNAWPLKKVELNVYLPEELFECPQDLFLFCGSLNLKDICDSHDVNTFDITQTLFSLPHI